VKSKRTEVHPKWIDSLPKLTKEASNRLYKVFKNHYEDKAKIYDL